MILIIFLGRMIESVNDSVKSVKTGHNKYDKYACLPNKNMTVRE